MDEASSGGGATDQYSAAYSFSHHVRADGTLWAWGNNNNGQLGLGDVFNRSSPVQVGSLDTWRKVGGTVASAGAIKADGTLWTWGYGSYGQTGHGDTTQKFSPVQVGSSTNWSAIAGGNSHMRALKTDGTLWAWGKNTAGELGDGTLLSTSSPIQIGSNTDFVHIVNSYNSNVVHRDIAGGGGAEFEFGEADVTILTYGRGTEQQLGDNASLNRSSPVQLGAAGQWFNSAIMNYTGLAVKNDNTLWTWGAAANGALGNGTTTPNKSSPIQVGSLTDWYRVVEGTSNGAALCIKTDGTLWAWGSNNIGQLGLGDVINRSSPVQVGTNTNWARVYSGEMYTVAFTNNNKIYAWGWNTYGQLGLGDQVNRSSPVQIGY